MWGCYTEIKCFDSAAEHAVHASTVLSSGYLALLKAGCSTIGLLISPSSSKLGFNAVQCKASFVKTVLCSLSL